MAGKVLYQTACDGDAVLPASSLDQALGALRRGLQNDLACPMGGVLDDAEAAGMPATIAAGLLAVTVEGEALGRQLQHAADVMDYYNRGNPAYRRGPPPCTPDMAIAVQRTARRYAMVTAGLEAMLTGAAQDAAEYEAALFELRAGRAVVSDDGTAIVAIAAGAGLAE